MAVNVIILAGAPADPDMTLVEGYDSRAMVPIGSKTMLQWVVDGINQSKSIGRVVAVGNVAADGIDEVIAPGGGFLENMLKGLDAVSPDEKVLIATCDIPLITGESIDDFISRSVESGGDMCYPIINKEACLSKYPDMKRTYFKTREGTFTGGNMMLLSPAFLRKNEVTIGNAYESRKNPFALSALVGIGVLLRAIVAQIAFPGLLPIPMLERVVSKKFDGKVVAIFTEYPEIGEDVDKSSDLEAVCALLGQA